VESPYKLDRIDTKSNDSPTFSAKLKKGLRIKQKNQKNFKELNKSLANLALKRFAGHSSIDKSATLSMGQIPSPYIIKKDLFEYNSNTSISLHKQRNPSYYIKSDYYTHRNKKNVGYSMDFAGNIITKPKKSPYRKYETQMNSIHDIHERSTKHNDFSSNSSIEMPPYRTRALFTDSKYLSENKDQHEHQKTSLSDLKPYLRADLQHSVQMNNPRPKNGKLDQRKISSDVKYLTGGVGLYNTVGSSEGTEEDLQEGNKEDLSVTVREFNYSRVSLQEKNEEKLQKEIKRDLTKIREDIEKRKISYQEVDDFVERHFNDETMKKKGKDLNYENITQYKVIEKRSSHKQSVFCHKPSTSLNKNKPHQKSKQICNITKY